MTTSSTVAAAVVLLLLVLFSSSQGIGAKCSKSDIMVVQSQGPPKYNGIPTYVVEILNRSPNGISISDIHVNCGWFSSADLINPNTFKRLKYNDCLVNGGRPLRAGYALSFTYTTTFKYPLSVSSIQC
ncbi:protein TAPETUM DETERMINANT 1-like [Ziziphus jujuba]|uniref:Protein TAPETUM DETERMINANT 1-like n=1 Tax=Ziziphus jujuba TaxID=326968 RepID=A0ABM4A8L6_ZIZJJ|nr:protein TAPETUM DETERMINANT 1-like [Ziziphus jujuba]